MCGIAGAAAANRRDVGVLVRRLTDALAHRGPDGSGFRYVRTPWAAIGHRRLSIVDLATGDQPMANEDGRVWVVFNGEIYNHLDLRAELEALGHTFRTRADTEVLVHGWEAWGPALFGRLNGIFALALYDEGSGTGEGQLVLARDPVGVKPLYVGRSGGAWWFASELAAAGGAGLLEGSLRSQAFGEYLLYRFVPSPGTFFGNAWKVPPGSFLRLDLREPASQPEFEQFEAGFRPASLPRSRGEWREALRQGLRGAVRRQLMSDVPVGSLLSGGVDSTVVTRLMKDGLVEPPQAFGIGFAGATETDELTEARKAAGALGVPLVEVPVSEAEYLDAWPEQVASFGEPIANSGVLLVGLLCRTVRRTHKVVLSGQGADEPLGGYPRHVAERFHRAARVLHGLLMVAPEWLASSDRVARMRRLTGEVDEARRFAETLAVFGIEEVLGLTRRRLDPEALVAPVRRQLPGPDEGDSVHRLLMVDARLSLADDLLIVADHTAMASSVELRVPFLDLELLALLQRMPSTYKVSRLGERKWLYRSAVAPLLPAAVRAPLTGWRSRTGRKLGFSTPLDRWFAGWLEADGERFLAGPDARLPAYLDPAPVRALISSVRRGAVVRSRQLLSLYVLEVWLRRWAA